MAASDREGSAGNGERLDRLKAFLADPATHGLPAGRMAGPIETHGAVVVLAGDRAYKIKKPVALPYMDLSTVAKRRRICRREVEINRRTAPELYLGVGAVTVGRDGRWRLRGPDEPLGEGERPVEPVVVMQRFDGDRLFDRLAERRVPMATLRAAAARRARPWSPTCWPSTGRACRPACRRCSTPRSPAS